MKRVLVGVLLIPAMLLVAGVVFRSDEILNFILGPVDDPQYFCVTPDPSPLADVGSSTVVQECSAGKTVSIGRGETIAVDLPNSPGVDQTRTWHDFRVSDGSVLQTVIAPTTRGDRRRSDLLAVYRAVKSGRSSISVMQLVCGAIGGACGRDHLWKVTIQAS
ncbi:MAG TPA: hypothetical protein VF383_07530 [Candidatus Dormibacteraeota bacterium]